MAAPETLLDHSDVRAVALGRVLVTAWRRAPRLEVIATLEEHTKGYHHDHRDGVALIIVPTRDAPDEAARNELRAFLLRMGAGLLGAAVVLPMSGLKGSILRGVASAAIATMRLPFDVKLVGSASDAAEHAARLLTGRRLEAPSGSEIEDLIGRATALGG
jgi:hypothetical protein